MRYNSCGSRETAIVDGLCSFLLSIRGQRVDAKGRAFGMLLRLHPVLFFLAILPQTMASLDVAAHQIARS